MATLGDAVLFLRTKNDGLDKGLADAEKQVRGAGSRLGGILTGVAQGIGQAAFGVVKNALGGVAGLVVSSVGAAADMEQKLADISASMGTTAEETAQLKTLISDLGLDPKLKVSATEAADAIQVLGTAGVSVKNILDGAARGTVLLANATGANFADAAAIASDAMALWGIEAKDLTDVVNGVTSTTVASKFGIDDYRLALAQAGGVAAGLGVEFNDFNAVIAAISPSFASGSDAGTSFKTLLQRLIPQSKAAVSEMRNLGLFTGLTKKEFEGTQEKIFKYQEQLAKLSPTSKDYETRAQELKDKITILQSSLVEGSNAFFDNEGNMKSMAEIAGILNTALAGLSDEQKTAAISTIFGTDAMRAAMAMAGYTQEEFAKLQATMAKTDAEEQAAKRMNTLRGALEILSGVFETLKLMIGDQFIPIIIEMVREFTTFLQGKGPAMIAWAGRLADLFRTVVRPAIVGLMGSLRSLFARVGEMRSGWATAWDTVGSYTATAWGVAEPIMAAAVAWLQERIPGALETLQGWWNRAWGTVQDYTATAWAVAEPIVAVAYEWLFTKLPAALRTLWVWWVVAWDVVKSYTATAWATAEPIVALAYEWLFIKLPAALRTLWAWWTIAWDAVKSYTATAWATAEPIVALAYEWLFIKLPEALATLKEKWETTWQSIKDKIAEAWGVIEPPLRTLWGWVSRLVTNFMLLDGSSQLIVGTLEVLGLALIAVAGAGGFGAVGAAIAALFSPIGLISLALVAVGLAVMGLGIAWNENWGGIQDATAKAWEAIEPHFNKLKEGFSNFISRLDELKPKFQALWDEAAPILEAIGTVIATSLGFWAVIAINFLAATFNNLVDVAGAVVDQITAFLGLLRGTFTGLMTLVKALVDGDWAAAWEAAKGIVSGFKTYADSTAENLKTVVGAAFRIIGETITGVLEGLGFDKAATAVQGVIDKVMALWLWIAALAAGNITLDFSTPQWLTDLKAWAWPAIAELAADWWPDIDKLKPDWWPDITKLKSDWWPDIGTPDWLQSFIDAVSNLLGWSPFGSGDNTAGTTAPNAGGSGGPGAPVDSSAAAQQSLFGGGGGRSLRPAMAGAGGTVINIYQQNTITTDMDFYRIGRRTAEELDRRLR